MRVLCPLCDATFEAQDAPEPGDGAELCDACASQACDAPPRATDPNPRPIFFDTASVPEPPRRAAFGEHERSSAHDDLRALATLASRGHVRRADADLLDLTGGLFAERSLPASAAPVRARTVPESVAPGPVVAERWPADLRAGRRDVAGWIVGGASLVAAATLLVVRAGGPDPAEPGAAPPRTAAALAAASAEQTPTTASAPSAPPSAPAPATAEPTPARASEHERTMVEPMTVARPVLAAPRATAAPEGAAFDRSAARITLAAAAAAALGCRDPGDAPGTGKVMVTFAPAGRVITAQTVGPPFQSTRTGRCIAAAFRGASVPAFAGDPVIVTRDVTVR